MKLLSFFATNYHKNKLFRNLFLCCFANIHYAEKIYTSSTREYLFLIPKCCENIVVAKVFFEFVALETLIIPKKYTID